MTNPKNATKTQQKNYKTQKTRIVTKSKSQIMTIQKVKVLQFKIQIVTKLKNLIG